MNADLKLRWLELNQRQSRDDAANQLWNEIEENYQQTYRAYHNLNHVASMLSEFDAIRDQFAEPVAIEWAVWFHDLYYVVGATDNELRSADRAQEAAHLLGHSAQFSEIVHQAIMATRAHTAYNLDAQLLVTLDLAVLGRSTEEFNVYDAAIHREAMSHPLYTDEFYRTKRLAWAETFVKRDPIYPTEYGRIRYEAAAKSNLNELIDNLK